MCQLKLSRNLSLYLSLMIGINATQSCKQRTTDFFKNHNKNDVPIIEVKPVEQKRVEELRIKFQQTLKKLKDAPEVVGATLKSNLPSASRGRPRTYIVRLRQEGVFFLGGENPDTPILAAGGVIKKRLGIIRALTAEFPNADDDMHMLAVQKFLLDSPHVMMVEPDIKVKANNVPNDRFFSSQWGLHGSSPQRFDIRSVEAWKKSTGSPSVVVGVVDTGIDYRHQDLAQNVWSNPGETGVDAAGRDKRTNKVDDDGNGYVDDVRGWDFVEDDNDPMDRNNHGTHVAGIIGAVGNNGIGISGVNWNVKLVGIRFLDESGEGYISDAIRAIDYSVKLKVPISNHSWGGYVYSQALFDALKLAGEAGQVVIAAAGNDESNNDTKGHFPSNYNLPNIIAVTATTKDGKLASFANFGRRLVHVAAPGVNILSTIPGDRYAYYQGTSMAAPHVAGSAALLKALDPSASMLEIRSRLLGSVTKIDGLATRATTGGILNLEAAVGLSKDETPPTPPSQLRILERGPSKAKISWRPSGDRYPVYYEIRFSETPISGENFANARLISDVEYEQSADQIVAHIMIEVGASGFLAVRARDDHGNDSEISESIAIRLLPMSEVASYRGQSLTELPVTTWVIENDALRGNVFSDGVGTYPPNASRHLRLPAMERHQVDRMILRFWHRLSLESAFDQAVVTIESIESQSEKSVTVFKQSVGEWTKVDIDLSDHIVGLERSADMRSFKIGFKLMSDGDNEADGWYLDDIQIFGLKSGLRVAGLPVGETSGSSGSMTVSQAEGQSLVAVDQYAWDWSKDGENPCWQNPGGQVFQSIGSSVGPLEFRLGLNILCLYVPFRDFTGGIKRFYAWQRSEVKPPVAAVTGLPAGVSNKRSFSAEVNGLNVYEYAFHVLAGDNAACEEKVYALWRPVSERLVFSVDRDQKTTVCVKGRSREGATQVGATTVTWTSDFTPPEVILSGAPPVSSAQTLSKINVQGDDVVSYRSVIINGTGLCEGWGEQRSKEEPIVINLHRIDGSRKLCVLAADQAGNEQSEPAVMEWVQDTRVEPLQFKDLPDRLSNLSQINAGVVASEAGRYQHLVASGTTCDVDGLDKMPLRPLSDPIKETLNAQDGPMTLCARLTDNFGNRQLSPTIFTWNKDTTAPQVVLKQTPSVRSTMTAISVRVEGESLAGYQYKIVGSKAECDGGVYRIVVPASTNIRETFTNKGAKTLCVKGVDQASNVQSNPTVFSWEIVSSSILTATILRPPLSPNSRRFINIGIASPKDQGIVSYRYAFAPGLPANCARVRVWSPAQSIIRPIVEDLDGYQGYRTLCVKGIDRFGFEQGIPTATTWLRFNGADVSPTAKTSGKLSVVSRSKGSVKLRVQRDVTVSQAVKIMVCPINMTIGELQSDRCRGVRARFAVDSVVTELQLSDLSSGNYAVVALPEGGRIEPIVFSL